MTPPRKAMSVPGRICANRSATAAVRVNRGSTTMRRALFLAFASTTHLKPQGWASAGFPPITRITLAFLMSTQ